MLIASAINERYIHAAAAAASDTADITAEQAALIRLFDGTLPHQEVYFAARQQRDVTPGVSLRSVARALRGDDALICLWVARYAN